MSYARAMSSFDPDGSIDEQDEVEGSYWRRHWRGQMPLAHSYWVNGALVNIALTAATLALAATEESSGLRLFGSLFVLFVLVMIVVRTWSLVGIWRSAGRHARRGGSPGWALVARIMVVIGLISYALQAPALWQQTREFALIAVGRDPIGEPAAFSLSDDGRSVLLKGSIVAGSAAALTSILDSAPQAVLVVLESDGGRIAEGLAMAKTIRAKKLATRVDTHCSSACTLLLLAGSERFADPIATIGFHQPTFPALSDADLRTMIDRNRRDYIKAGIAPAFVDRIMATPPEQLWHPTHQEMVDAGVLSGFEVVAPNARRRQQVVRALDELASATNAAKGEMVDEVTRLDGARRDGNTVEVLFTVTKPLRRSKRALEASLKPSVVADVCGSARGGLVQAGASFRLHYRDTKGATLAKFTVDRCDPV